MSDEFVIETRNLRKNYGSVEALRGLNLKVSTGSICAFLGRNGAGKTTALKVLLGMARADQGSATVFGLRPQASQEGVEIRRRAAFVSEEKDLYSYMTVDQMIRFTAPFYPLWRDDLEQRYLRDFELPRDRKVKTFSRGMRTKVALLLAFCRGAELLLLDEPTAGLDPAIAEQVLQALVAHVAGEGMTVLFSSHQISEVEQIADHVAIIDRGRDVLADSLDELRQNYRRIQMVFDDEAPELTFHSAGVRRVQRNGRVMTVLASAGADGILKEAEKLEPRSVDMTPVTLKEIFLNTLNEED